MKGAKIRRASLRFYKNMNTLLIIYTTKSNGATHSFCNELSELSELSGNV
jgi:hypothetical protein